MEIKGRILEIHEEELCSETFRKRDFVVEYKDKDKDMFKQVLKFETCQQKCSLLDNFKEGDIVKIDFVLRGYKYQRSNWSPKYYLSLRVIDIQKIEN